MIYPVSVEHTTLFQIESRCQFDVICCSIISIIFALHPTIRLFASHPNVASNCLHPNIWPPPPWVH